MKFRVSILNLLLLLAVVGVWTAVWMQRTRTAKLEPQLPELRKLSRELIVSDPALVHTVRPHQQWFGEESWLIYIPDNGETFQLNLLATPLVLGQPISGQQAKEAQRYKLAAGEHRVELKEKMVGTELRYLVYVDDQLALEEVVASNWRDPNNRGSFNSSSSTGVRDSQFHLGDKRGFIEVVLKRCRYYYAGGARTNQPTHGILLWFDNDPPRQ